MDKSTDFLVIGGGVAGLRAALEASCAGKVILLNKGTMEESASQKAQGGIAVVLNAEEDELESHYQDTLDAGHGLCSPEAVRVLVQEGPQRIHELIEWGAQFDKMGSTFAPVLEGAHRKPRILRAHGDATGLEIVKTLRGRVQQSENIQVSSNHFALDLITEEGQCKGVWVMDDTDRVYPILSQGVILATGGAGQIFERTTNPPLATGDGIAIALRAGVLVEDMEFIQFHPTALSLPHAPAFLLSEAMRGEGAKIINSDGKPFMMAYHPAGDLAPRDIVTRGIVKEIALGQKVFLDLTHLPADFVRKRFPTLDATCQVFGVDMTREPIPVAPAAHYMMGGIKTDLMGKTSIERLWAAGEVAATGVHGANRLASNALLEGLVFGARAGRAVAVTVNSSTRVKREHKPAAWKSLRQSISQHPPTDYFALEKQLKEMMWNEVGIIRSEASLKRARDQLRSFRPLLSEPLEGLPPAALRKVLEIQNEIMAAASIVATATIRKESIGAHFREDASLKTELLFGARSSCKEPISQNKPHHFSFQWSDICEALF